MLSLLDKKIFYFFNAAIKNNVFDILLPLITRLSEDFVIIVIGFLFFIFGKKKEKRISLLILIALFLSRVSVIAIKHLTHRPRPNLVYEHVNLIGKPVFSSFPSGHTTLATAICIVLCLKYKKLSPIFIALAILVGLSRLYVGQHYPTDVIAGFILGSIVATAVLFLDKFLQKNKSGSAA